MTVFAGVVIGTLILTVLLALGVGVAFKKDAGWWFSAVLFLGFICLVVVVSPYRVWARERKKVEDFEEATKQKINVSWRVSRNKFAELILTNISSRTLPRIEVSFRNYRMADGSDITDILRDMIAVGKDVPSMQLDPLMQTFFRFATIWRRVDDKPFIALTLPKRNPLPIEECEIGVKLAVSGENIPAQSINLRVIVSDDGSLTIDPWEAAKPAVSPGGASV